MPVNPQNESAFVAGVFVASNYAKWKATVTGPSVASASPATVSLDYGVVALPDGRTFCPFAVSAPVSIGTGASQDTVTLTAVSNCFLGAAIGTPSITGNTSHSHGQGDIVSSSSGGVFEAALDASNNGGGTVVIDANSGATAANIAAARVLYPSIIFNDMRTSSSNSLTAVVTLTSTQLLAIQTTAINIAPAPGAGFVAVPRQMFLEYIFKTTAYTIANADNAFRLEYTGKTTTLASTLATGLVDQTASTSGWVNSTSPITAIANTNCANLGLELKLAIGTTPALTLGDGTVKVVLKYDVVTL